MAPTATGIATDQQRKSNFLPDEITAIEDIEAKQHALFGGLKCGLPNTQLWECAAAAVDEVRQKDTTVADLKKTIIDY